MTRQGETPANKTDSTQGALSEGAEASAPSQAQGAWLRRGLEQAGGKLPLFDEQG